VANSDIIGTLRAILAADTSSFTAAMRDAAKAPEAVEKSVSGLSGEVQKLTPLAEKMVKSLGGDKLLYQANSLTAAVTKLGGASRLTEAEQARVNATVTKAIDKYAALGKQAPIALHDLAAATKPAEQETNRLNDALTSSTKRILEYAAGFFTAQAAMAGIRTVLRAVTGEIEDLVMHGSAVADVSDNFDHMTKAANLSGAALLGALRQGTHNTIADFTLMKMVNDDLAAGLKLTDAQYRTLATGAFALAQAKAISVTDALELMNEALVTGRAKGIARLTGKISETKAEEDYARKLGVSREELTETAKLHAMQIAMLARVSAATSRLGEQTDGLDERVAQLQTKWRNLNDDLGKTVANSPVLNAALAAIDEQFSKAFGPSRDDLIKGLGLAIDKAAIDLVEFGRTALFVFQGTAEGAAFLADGIAGVVQAIVDLRRFKLSIDAAPLPKSIVDTLPAAMRAQHEAAVRQKQDLDDLSKHLEQFGSKAESVWKGGAFDAGFKRMQDLLTTVRTRMVDAQTAATNAAGATKKAGDAALGAAGNFGDENEALTKTTKQFAEAMQELASVGRNLNGVLDTIDGTVVEAVKFYLQAGVAQDKLAIAYGLTAVQVKAVNEALEYQIGIEKVLAEIHKTAIDLAKNQMKAPIEQADRASRAQLESIAETYKAQLDASKTIREISFDQAQFQIDQAKRRGVNEQAVMEMEIALSHAKANAAVADINRQFDAEERLIAGQMNGLDQTVPAQKALYDQLSRQYTALVVQHHAAVDQIVLSERMGEQAKREEYAITHNLALRFIADLKAAALDGARAASESLAKLLVFGSGVTAQTKLAAQQARDQYEDAKTSANDTAVEVKAAYEKMQAAQKAAAQKGTAQSQLAAQKATDDYNKIARTGQESALTIQAAYERMREAEDAANTSFAHKFVGAWQWIKESISKVLSDLLNVVFKGFIDGVLKRLAASSLGEKVGGWLSSLLGGGGGGLSGNSGNQLINNFAGKLLGTGAAAAGVLGAGSTVLADGSVIGVSSAALGSTAAAGGSVVAAGAGAGTAGAAGGGIGASLGAFFTNPWTIGIGAALVTGLLLAKHFGKDKVNKPRDQFIAQFGDPSDKGDSGGAHKLAAQLTAWGQGDGGGPLFAMLQGARKDMNAFHRAEAAIADVFKQHGKSIKLFNMGGFVPPNVTQPAILHGGGMGEIIVPLDKVVSQRTAGSQSPVTHNSVEFHIQTMDPRGMRDVIESDDFMHALTFAITQNKGRSTVPQLRKVLVHP
jgi:hypothetical protein